MGVRGAHVLVTGAASGMGTMYADRAAREGASRITLWDRDVDGLTAVQQKLSALRDTVADIHVETVDLSQRAEVLALAEQLPRVDVLINNAGIVKGALFTEHSVRDIAATLDINVAAPMVLTHTVLPAMIADAHRPARIVNIASAAGLLSNPRMSVYAASKAALVNWGESLRLEMERGGHEHVKVTTVCPSYVSTGMFEGARGPLLTPILTPEKVVDRVWRAMLVGKPLVMTPWMVRASLLARGVMPLAVWDAVGGEIFGVYSSMDHFTGRGGDQ